MPHTPTALTLNLADWIERRRSDTGPYADHIIHSVRHYEAEIKRLDGLLVDRKISPNSE